MRIEDVIRARNGMDIQNDLSGEQRLKSRMKSIEASKSRMRRKLAARPVAEKLRMLDDLRARTITLKRAALKDPRRTIR